MASLDQVVYPVQAAQHAEIVVNLGLRIRRIIQDTHHVQAGGLPSDQLLHH